VLARAAWWLALTPAGAGAYPHYPLATGSRRCTSCHHAPAGGGLLTAHGRYAAADEIARGWPWDDASGTAGDARPFHGAARLPSWADAGADARLALLSTSGSDAPREWHLIPMQADVSGRVAAGGFSLQATAGLRASARPRGQPPSSHVVSREHWAMWRPASRPGAGGFYARAGRFMPPYGLRLVDHTAYVRRSLGFDLLAESYGASAGTVHDRFELHATAFFLNPYVAEERDERGAAAYAEVRVGPTAWGASFRWGDADTGRRAASGVTGKVFVSPAETMLLGEIDLVRQAIGQDSRDQLVTYAAAVVRPTRGAYAAATHEFFDEDLAVRDVERQAIGGWLAYVPRAWLEILAVGRTQFIGRGQRASVAMLMMHYAP
jgi:hypothetical protein